MEQELSQELIHLLVEIGETERFDDCEKILTRFPHLRSGMITRLRPEPWREAAIKLDVVQLVALIKTLTVLESGRLPGFGGGSVSPVFPIMRLLAQRSRDVVPATVDWVLAHSDNCYLPWGNYNHGAKCFAELRDAETRLNYFSMGDS